MEPFFELVPLTEMLDFTVLLVLYFLGVCMVVVFDELQAPNPQVATIRLAAKMSGMMRFELFLIVFILSCYFFDIQFFICCFKAFVTQFLSLQNNKFFFR